MRILQLCPKVPWPPDDGGRVAMRTLALSLLETGAEVRTLSLNPLKHRVEPCSLPDEARAVRLEAVEVDTTVTVAGALKSLVSGGSYNVERFFSPSFARRAVEVVREEVPDAVLLESLFLVPYVPALRAATRAPLVLRSVNVEHQIWESLARGERSLPRRLYLAHLARRLRAYEVETLNDVDAILPVTPVDETAYRRLGATVPLHVVPVGIPVAGYPDRSGSGEPRTLVFLGSLDWRPNLEALRWFLDDVWPLVRRAVPDARFHVAGSNAPATLVGPERFDGVRFLGRVPDAHEFLASGAAMVVPLLSGGGMRVKVLEAMALGVPIVSTRLGATGIGAGDGAEILLADTPDRFADACTTLLEERDRALSIGRAARELVIARFDANSIARRLLGSLSELRSGRDAGRGASSRRPVPNSL